MNDPFFDEDDGEFDDLYENPRPLTSSPSVRPKERNKDAPVAPPVTPSGDILTRSPAASSSVVSRSYARDRTGSPASTVRDLGKQDKGRKKRGKPRRKASQELFDVQWESDVKVAKCGLCCSDFSLVKRKHHCRPCGRVMCSDCSSFLYFEFSHRKHRVCGTCNKQLLAEQETYDREKIAGRSQEANLFDTSSDDGSPSVAVTPASSTSGEVQQKNLRPKPNGDEEKTRKKQEKKERKKEKLKKKGTMLPVENTGIISRGQAGETVQTAKRETALFDGADDDWFTDVPVRNARSRDSSDEYSEAGSKGPGWRDRVKDTYTISVQPSVLPPMTGSTLTAGITGKGYISDQFRYDAGGPALGHDGDLSVAMPRPKQQSATTPYTDNSIKPSRHTGNGYFSEQFQYDVDGPGLGHGDDRVVGMPRPKQQPVAAPYSYNSVDPSQKLYEHNSPDDSGTSDHDFQPHLTFKDNSKDMFGTKRRESSAKRKEKKVKASTPRARGNKNMTLDELNPSYSSEDEPRMFASAMPRPTAISVQPTFYENDADKVVVDDAPGFFEATIAEREARRKKDEEQHKQLARDMAWVNSSAVPPTVSTHRFSSEQDSYSIVDHPSHTSNSPVQNQRVSSAGATATGSSGNTKGGFTGALKRFFGMESKAAEKATTPPKSTKLPPPAAVIPPEKIGAENHPVSVPENTHPASSIPTEPASSGLARHTVVNYYESSRQDIAPQESFRNTTGAYAVPKDAHYRFEATAPSQIGGARQHIEQTQQKPERKRRGTFDDLFESPKTNQAASGTDRYGSAGTDEWAVRGGENPNVERGASAVGVARFDQRRSIDEADEFTLGHEPKPSTGLSNDSTEVWRRSAAMSLLNDRKEATQSEGSAFTWSNVRSAPGLGTATYAVPTSLQPHAVYNDDRLSSDQRDTSSAPLGNIMDDLKHGSSLKKSPAKESVDDFFAEFEEPNDYVFDPATGGYVAARAPLRAAVSRPVSRSVSTELQSPRTDSEKAVPRSSGREYDAPSETLGRATAVAVIEKEVGDEVADIIVDKISSLEGELAALKQLIRNRNGSGGHNNPGGKVRERRTSARPSVRKESIFHNDSSDEDSAKPSDPYASSIQPALKRAGKRRPDSKKKSIKKRKDSFADLFEDSPNENETFGGATSYEALFQTGAKATEGTKEEGSDEDVEHAVKSIKRSTSKSRRRSSRKKIDPVSPKEDSSEPEFASLKGRRGKSLRRKNDDDTGIFYSSSKSKDQLVTMPAADIVPASKPIQGQAEEEDPIDALFDSSNDRDVAKLYGEDDDRDREDKNVVVESQPDLLLNGSSVLFTQASSISLSDDDASGADFTVATSTEPVAPVDSPAYSLDSQALVNADEDEEFSINWTKMRKTKSQRHKSRRNPSASTVSADESIPADDSTENLLLGSSLLGVDHQEPKPTTIEDVVSDQVAVPPTFLADASSNWMSISTLEDETVNLSFAGDKDVESLLQPVGENKSLESTVGSTVPDGNKSNEEHEAAQSPISISDVSELSPSEANDKLSLRDDDTDDEVLSNRSSEKLHSDSPKADDPRVSEAAFDIFDKSNDVDFLSATPPMDLKAPSHADDSDNDDRVSLLGEEETFSFEIKVPKKRVSGLDATANISSTHYEPERAESSPPSPTSSVDENIELGKYTASSVPSSMDGSVDDPEDAPLDDESLLGKVESQAFDLDWHQMQAKEKERKKRLQAKQRQTQRDKVLRKHASSRSLTGGSTKESSSKRKSKTGKKKKKDKDDTSSSSHHKKSRKHRHRDGDSTTPSQPPRSLTEL